MPTTSTTTSTVRLRIEATDLPGRSCAPVPGFPGYTAVQVGVQRKGRPGELLDPVAGDADEAVWTVECTVKPGPAGPDLMGPYVQGGPGARFVYLTWLTPGPDGPALLRRAKLFLDAVPPATLGAAVRGGLLVGRLGLTDAKGHPLCGAVRPPVIAWSAGGGEGSAA
ncbi:DUF5990 family protein [Kitasatospora sp. NPDC058406]|uniref:DUF5990 family protein n=1 Tax=Kitasatospora sp. NPDC058406 TaxID=3346483 RepID=UPI00365DD930